MKTKTSGARGAVVLILAAVAAGLGGCASTGEGAGASGGAAPTAAMGRADFYADWYDSTAVVLPPPPTEKARR